MPQWFLPYTAAALVAAALGWLALNYDPDAGSPTATPSLAGAPAPGKPGSQPAPTPAPAGGGDPSPAAAPAPAVQAAPATTPGESAVRRLVNTSFTTDRASDCTRLYTQAFLEQLSGKTGADAVEKCRDDSDGDPDADSVVFNEVTPAEGGFRVAVTLAGGDMDGTSFDFTAIRRGNWKIDRLLGVDLDMNRLAAEAAEEAREEGASAEDAACLESRVAVLNESDYERSIVEGRSDDYARAMLKSTLGCLSAESLRKQLAEGIRSGAGNAPEALIECVIDQIVGGKSAAELRALIQMDDAAGYEMGRRAGIACARAMTAAPTSATS
jgi:hypothetical protein